MDEKIPKILKRGRKVIETADSKRQQVFLAQREAILLEQLAPHSKTNASRIMLTLKTQSAEQSFSLVYIWQRSCKSLAPVSILI